ncbi:dihydrodipicolinate synthase family protein [Parapedobacter pyrenivorans]|uniref:Dihydrodipicolinate synthase family protein n=1 Tax=Parapedobacter pyrenivorans TaxID=1305674 RepID=A0A917M944_9SPHI|nr:dihydrodipicolinate synthase family protein [Parapedobacter pyrenivorans]GGG85594.1 dihydrodipicolinate synthase family protein [Parapedobacter pyrenivorans]
MEGKLINDTCSRRAFIKGSFTLGMTGLIGVNTDLLPIPRTVEPVLIPVMLTPFHKDLSVDTYCLEKLIEFYKQSGAGGFFANCLSSEMYQLNRNEQLNIAAITAKRAGNDIPVVATGSFGEKLEDRIECTKQMAETGVDAVVLITSHFAEKEQDARIFLDHVLALVDRTPGIPLGTYECPTPYKRLLSTWAFRTLNETRRFTYHKDTSEDIEQLTQKIEISRGGSYNVFNAHSGTAVSFIQRGGSGLSPIAGNFFPEIFSWICEHANKPDQSAQLEYMQQELIRAEKIVSLKYPLSAKYFLRKRGLPIQLNSRVPREELTKTEVAALDGLYGEFEVWCNDLGISPARLI